MISMVVVVVVDLNSPIDQIPPSSVHWQWWWWSQWSVDVASVDYHQRECCCYSSLWYGDVVDDDDWYYNGDSVGPKKSYGHHDSMAHPPGRPIPNLARSWRNYETP